MSMMDPILSTISGIGGAINPFAPLITGGASLLGSMFGSSTSQQVAQQQMANQQQLLAESEQFNAGQSQQAEMFTKENVAEQERYNSQMANTAYQRSVADMKRAGLNPAMMFMRGGGPAEVPGVSAPGGPSSSVGTPQAPTPGRTGMLAGIGDAVKTAMSTAVQQKEMDLLTQKTAAVDLENKQTQNKMAMGLSAEEMSKLHAEIEAIKSSTKGEEQNQRLRALEDYVATHFADLPEPAKGIAAGIGTTVKHAGDIWDLFPAKGIAHSAAKGVASGLGKAPGNEVGTSATAVRKAMDDIYKAKAGRMVNEIDAWKKSGSALYDARESGQYPAF